MDSNDLPVVCAWCNAPVSAEIPAGHVSHGICVPCAIGFLKRLPPDYLKSIAEPDGTVALFSGHQFEVPA